VREPLDIGVCGPLALSRDGSQFFAVVDRNRVLRSDPGTRKQKSWQLPGEICSVALSPDDRYLALGHCNGNIYILRVNELPKKTEDKDK
jgi:hypothetical protein